VATLLATFYRLAHKEAVVAESASWLFRIVPYLVFAATLGRRRAGPDLRDGIAVQVGRRT